jgi:O-antigen/teichoic acid export membrane protein
VISGYVASFGLRFFFSLLLTRFLEPSVFGMAMLATSVASTVTLAMDLGLLQYLLRISETEFKAQRHAIWTYQVLHGAALSFVIVLAALISIGAQNAQVLPESSAMSLREFPFVLFVLASVPLIQGFRSTQLCFQMRQLNRKPIVLLDLTAHLISIGSVIAYLHWVAHDVWALAIGWVTYMLSHTYLGFTSFIGRTTHRLEFSRDAFTSLKKFVPWIWGSSVVHVFVSQADKLLLGVIATSAWLGIYSVSLSILGAVSGVLSALISSIGLPKLSKSFHEGADALNKNYSQYSRLTDYAIVLSVTGMIALGGFFVRLVFPERFFSAGDLLELVAAQIYLVRSQFTTQVFLAMNRPALQFRLSAMQAVVLIIALPAGYLMGGVQGCVIAISIAAVLVAAACIEIERRIGLPVAYIRSFGFILLPAVYLLSRFWH